MSGFFGKITSKLSALSLEILKESSPLLLGIYTIMFGLFTAECLQRVMAQIFPLGVGHFEADGVFRTLWRIASLVIFAITLCIFFVHTSFSAIRMRPGGNLVAIYTSVFYVLYLTITPWVSLHLARLFAALVLPGINVKVDWIFVLLYLGGFLFLRLFMFLPFMK